MKPVAWSWILSHLAEFEHWRDAYPMLAVLLFCLAHLSASTLAIPGGCTILNILSGALFGFWRGCAIVYPITLLSATLTYWAANSLIDSPFIQRYRERLSGMKQHLLKHDYLYFVLLRLSPLLPFNVINIFMGALDIPYRIYIVTTLVGIFFDVVLLNSLGASFKATGIASATSSPAMWAVFLTLFGVSIAFRFWTKRELT